MRALRRCARGQAPKGSAWTLPPAEDLHASGVTDRRGEAVRGNINGAPDSPGWYTTPLMSGGVHARGEHAEPGWARLHGALPSSGLCYSPRLPAASSASTHGLRAAIPEKVVTRLEG
jgi:hypothetical protein